MNHSDAKRNLFLKARWARDKRLGREQPQTAIVEPRINPLAMVCFARKCMGSFPVSHSSIFVGLSLRKIRENSIHMSGLF